MKEKSWLGLFVRRNWRLIFQVLLALVTLVLGMFGFTRQDPVNNFCDNLYLTLQLFVLQSGAYLDNMNVMLEVARFSGASFTFLAAIQILVSVFDTQSQLLKIKIAYRGHVIICGLGGIGPILAERYLSERKKVVVIEIKPDNKYSQLVKEQGGIVLTGDGADPELLRKAGIRNASLVVAVCGSDGKNSEIVSQVTKFAREKHRLGLCCYAHILNPHLCHYLAGQAVTSYTDAHFQVEFFNVFDSGARLILEEDAMKLSFKSESSPHLAVIGLNEVGQSLVLRAERAARAAKGKQRPRLTVIDPQAGDKLKLVECSCASLDRTFKLSAYEENILNASFINAWLDEDLSSRKPLTQIYICLDDDSEGLTLGLMLVEKLRDRKMVVPILVCMLGHGGLEDILEDREGGSAGAQASRQIGPLLAFDLLERTCNTSISAQGLFEDLAIAVHEHYRKEGLAKGETPASNPALRPWFSDEGIPALLEEHKEQNRRQARRIGASFWRIGCGIEPAGSQTAELFSFAEGDEFDRKRAALLEALGARQDGECEAQYFNRLADMSKKTEPQVVDWQGERIKEDELEFLARQEHESWLQQKMQDGWKYGPEKSDANKTSPNMLPWYDPRLKDADTRQFTRKSVRIWPELLAAVGLRIYRRD